MDEPDLDRAAALFADAAALPESEREAFLAEACGADSELRAEVRSLLSVLPGARRLFSSFLPLADDGAANPAPPEDPMVGKLVGPYRLLELIAAGGMGTVHLGARTDEEYQRRVAIKMIRPGLGSAEIIERFRRERQVLADLEHPNIARLLDGGTTKEGQPYLVMEFVDGSALDRFADAAHLGLVARLRLFLTVCQAVQFAHGNLVIHRDIKPSNILVDRSGQVKLLDFGVAKVLGEEASGAGVDADGTMITALTPRYASPEQVLGRRVSTATDVYSLGVVLYELLTGSSPYRVPTRLSPDAVRVISETEPVRPSRAAARCTDELAALRGLSPAKLAQELKGDLDTILSKALSKEPERRYASAHEFAQDIQRHLDHLPVLAAPDRPTYRIRKFVRRHRALSVAVASVLIVLVSALLVTHTAYRRAEFQRAEVQRIAYVSSLAAAEAAIRENAIDEAQHRLAGAPLALRGWEWRHLAARLDRSSSSVDAHAAGVTRVLFAPDGRALLTTSVDGSIKEWDVASSALVRSWGPFDASVESAALSTSGQWLVAGLGDGRVLLIDRENASPPVALHETGYWPMVAISPASDRVAAIHQDGMLRIWDRVTHQLLASWQAHAEFGVVAWSPDGETLVTGGGEGAVKVWDLRTQRELRSFQRHSRRIYSLTISPDGRRVASGSMDHSAVVHDLGTGEHLTTFHGHHGTVAGLAFTPDGEAVASCSPDGRFLRWDVRNGRVLAELRGHRADVSAIAVSPDGLRLASADWNGNLRTWDASTNDVRVLRPPSSSFLVPRVVQAAITTDGRWIAAVSDRAQVPVWSLFDAASPLSEIAAGSAWVSLAFSHDHRYLIGGSSQGELEWVDTETWMRHASIAAHQGPLHAIAVHPDGKVMATAAEDGFIKIWPLDPTGAAAGPARTLAGHTGAVFDLEFSADGEFLASCGADSTLRLWHWQRGEISRVLRGHAGAVTDLAFSPTGRRIASTGGDGTLRLWDLASGQLATTRDVGRARAGVVTWSHDGHRLALAGGDGVVRILSAEDLHELVGLRGHVSRVNHLVFSADDAHLVSTSRDGTVRIWDAPQN